MVALARVVINKAAQRRDTTPRARRNVPRKGGNGLDKSIAQQFSAALECVNGLRDSGLMQGYLLIIDLFIKIRGSYTWLI